MSRTLKDQIKFQASMLQKEAKKTGAEVKRMEALELASKNAGYRNWYEVQQVSKKQEEAKLPCSREE